MPIVGLACVEMSQVKRPAIQVANLQNNLEGRQEIVDRVVKAKPAGCNYIAACSCKF